MKLFVCRFLAKDSGDYGYKVSREITPILAQDAEQALDLVVSQHGEYLAEFYSKDLNALKRSIVQYMEFEELKTKEIWSNGPFISQQIRTPIG